MYMQTILLIFNLALVRLTGGELVREGLVQFYDGTNWGSICALR